MKFVALVSLIFLCSCKESIEYPEGGYDYPKNITDEDTNFYYCPIKNIVSKRDSFRISFNYLFYKPFDEPNLSLKPLAIVTFRLTYSTARGGGIIITLSDGLLTIKEGNPDTLYNRDTSKLTLIENRHLKLLDWQYPINTNGKKPRQKKYLDSMIKLYPQLLDLNYYQRLLEKVFVRKYEKFRYDIESILLSKKSYNSLLKEINSSGFWILPYEIECPDDVADGYTIRLEANTKRKYQISSISGCSIDNVKFTKVCQKIMSFSKLSRKHI